jgi:hypothetical protein
MIRAALLVVALGSCAFAHKHPAVTAGIASGMIALVPCLPAVEHPTTCLAISAVVGLGIGGITGLVTTFADTSAHALPSDEEPEPPIVRHVHTTTPPPPGPVSTPPVDAGVPVVVDGAVPESTIDAGFPL